MSKSQATTNETATVDRVADLIRAGWGWHKNGDWFYVGTMRCTVEEMGQAWRLVAVEARERADCVERALRRIAKGDVPGEGDWGDCVQAFAASALAPRNEYEGPCPACGAKEWVSVSLDRGYTRRPQCVPCGHVHAVVLGAGTAR